MREIDDDEGRRLVRIIRRGSGSVVTWRRAQNASDMPDFRTLSALDADMDAVRPALEVDVIGPWALVQSMLPLLTAAPAARIVTVSSLSALQIATGLDLGASLRAPAYSMAKYMLNALTSVLARAFADTPVLVNAVGPGDTATHPRTRRRRGRPPGRSGPSTPCLATPGETCHVGDGHRAPAGAAGGHLRSPGARDR